MAAAAVKDYTVRDHTGPPVQDDTVQPVKDYSVPPVKDYTIKAYSVPDRRVPPPGDVRPQELPTLQDSLRALKLPTSAVTRSPTPGSSVYGRAAASVPDAVRGRLSKDALLRRFRTLETSVRLPGTTLLLLVLPDPGPPPAEQLHLAQAVARLGARTVLLGPDLVRSVPEDPRLPVSVALRKDDPLAAEWAMIACGPAKRLAILGQCTSDGSWTSVLTRDSLAVQRAATAVLERVPFLGLRVPMLDGA
ncbi:MAG: hypothetical protein JWL64_2767 [Frankiales bacterium]|nr:hypothetical protein [Frankiales bacterium]